VVQLRLPVKVVVFNNGALGFIEIDTQSCQGGGWLWDLDSNQG
jgi:thiamine pyrophosphate-dependent acetolactate synthase large subunit-like protein